MHCTVSYLSGEIFSIQNPLQWVVNLFSFRETFCIPWQGDGSAVAWGSPFAGGDTSEAFGGGGI